MADETIATNNCLIAWDPDLGTGAVKVGRWDTAEDWSQQYMNTTGACGIHWHEMTPDERIAQLFVHFHELVIGDGMDPKAVHREFLKIEGFRERVLAHIPGEEPRGEN